MDDNNKFTKPNNNLPPEGLTQQSQTPAIPQPTPTAQNINQNSAFQPEVGQTFTPQPPTQPYTNPIGQPVTPTGEPYTSKTTTSKLKKFFLNRTNRVLVFGLAIVLVASIIIGIASSSTGQNNSSRESASPSESAPTSSENSAGDTEEKTASSSQDDISNRGTETINCNAKKEFYSLNINYNFVNGTLNNYSITLDLDKTDPDSLSPDDAVVYSNLETLGNTLNSYKATETQGITVTSSNTDSALYVWLKATRERITDEQALNNFFAPYDSLTADDIIKSGSQFGDVDYGLTCAAE